MEVAWNQLDPRLRGVDGLDDIMRFDLQHFCRRMQPPDEPHHRSAPLSPPHGSLSVSLKCMRQTLRAQGPRALLEALLRRMSVNHALIPEPILHHHQGHGARISVVIVIFVIRFDWEYRHLCQNSTTRTLQASLISCSSMQS